MPAYWNQRRIAIELERWLSRPFDDLSAWKRRPLDELLELLRRTGYVPITEPRPYQLVPILLGMKYRNLMFYIGMGGGKTKIISDVFRFRQQRGKCRRMLFLVDTVNAMFSIPRTLKHHYDGRVYVHSGPLDTCLRESLRSKADIVVIPYAHLPRLFFGGRDENGKWLPDMKTAQHYATYFDMIAFDEVHRLRDWRTLWWQLCAAMTEVIPYRYGLTGTPTDRHFEGFWAMHWLVDRGATFGERWYVFKKAFFSNVDGRLFFRKRGLRLFNRLLKHRAIVYTNEEISKELPALVYVRKYVALDADVRKLYVEELSRYRARYGNVVDEEKLHSFTKLRQVASGFVYTEEGVTVRLSYNPKYPVLLDLLRRIPEDRKCVIFYEFTASVEMIEGALRDAGITQWLKIAGNVQRDTRAELEARFSDPEGPRVCVAQSRAGGTSLNLQAASVLIFYETPVSYITREQCIRRVHRDGQSETTYIVDLLIEDGIEERLLRNHETSGQMVGEVLDEW